jgi:hypothetical protein
LPCGDQVRFWPRRYYKLHSPIFYVLLCSWVWDVALSFGGSFAPIGNREEREVVPQHCRGGGQTACRAQTTGKAVATSLEALSAFPI